jgi:hypothetical protein
MRNEDKLLDAVEDIRNWIRAAAHSPVKASLESALPDAKSRAAYQMLDGTTSMDEVRIKCKMSPNALIALAGRCAAMGLMEVTPEGKRHRLFDLGNFDLLPQPEVAEKGAKK